MDDQGPMTATVIGAGPAGLMAAEVLSAGGVQVTVMDRMPSVGRKFLMAGKSGLNLTKVEDPATFAAAYGDAPPALRQALADVSAQRVIDWAAGLGQPIFTGSTGRVFPEAMKASPLLRAWLTRLDRQGVTVRTRWRWTGWDGDASVFDTPDGPRTVQADVTILAMGGASWRRLGSDGAWANRIGDVAPFAPANCGFLVSWSDYMTPFFGTPVKATLLRAGTVTSRGEWVISRTGIEGGGVYAVSAAVRDGAPLTVDLLPDLAESVVARRLSTLPDRISLSQALKKAFRLPPVKIALYQEMIRKMPQSDGRHVASFLKALPIAHGGPTPLDDAISTAGGLRFAALDGFILKDRPGVFAAGEMLDWEAPTGGYLLTGCLATGHAAGRQALTFAQSRRHRDPA